MSDYEARAKKAHEDAVRQIKARLAQRRATKPDYKRLIEEALSPLMTREERIARGLAIGARQAGLEAAADPLSIVGRVLPKGRTVRLPFRWRLHAYRKPVYTAREQLEDFLKAMRQGFERAQQDRAA